MKAKIRPVGGNSLYIELCSSIDLECNKKVRALGRFFEEKEGIVETVIGYGSLLIIYDPEKVSWRELSFPPSLEVFEERSRLFRVPAVYGGRYGPDLAEVARMTGLDEEEVIRIHLSRVYTCYMLGFTPGFAYLGDLDERIAVPRRPAPRLMVPAGSLGIAGRQTGWYGVESPGGWMIIGRVKIRTFDPKKEPPTFIKPGDRVEFYRVEG